jgi:hypothetical protein
MHSRLLPLALACMISLAARSQQSPTGAALPSPEEFLNAIASTVVDTSFDHYYLVAGTDSCRFEKYSYDEWIKYRLKEPLTFNTLNELSEKVYLSRYPYFWKQPHLQKAILVTRKQADSILGSHAPLPDNAPSRVKRKWRQNLKRLPAWQLNVCSFSLPQFTDDGQYAVIDLNVICGTACGKGLTCIYRLTATGEWKLVGQYANWSS